MEPYIDNQFQHHQSQQSNSGLLRFRSAPSSLLSSFKGYDFNQSPVPESTQSIPVSETKQARVSLNGYSGFDPNQLPPQYPKPGSVMDGPFRVEVSNSMAMDQSTQGKSVSNLTRQNSSPAGFFSQLHVQNAGYGMMRGMGESSPRSSRLKPQIDFQQGLSTSIGRLPRIPEIGAEMAKESEIPNESGLNHKCRNGEDDSGRFYNPTGYAFTSWNDPASLGEGPSGLKGHQQNDKVLFSGLDASSASLQNGSLPHRTHMLSHHLSLPKTSAEMEAVEKLLNFQDSVPCKIRAKRGCATHPRSIAERVRRTRISDRMKKLQDLVPNMDKQVNTADMLDFAVDYIKELQKQYKKLSDTRARCECIHLQQSATDGPS